MKFEIVPLDKEGERTEPIFGLIYNSQEEAERSTRPWIDNELETITDIVPVFSDEEKEALAKVPSPSIMAQRLREASPSAIRAASRERPNTVMLDIIEADFPNGPREPGIELLWKLGCADGYRTEGRAVLNRAPAILDPFFGPWNQEFLLDFLSLDPYLRSCALAALGIQG